MEADDALPPPTAEQILARVGCLFRQFTRQGFEYEWECCDDDRSKQNLEDEFAEFLDATHADLFDAALTEAESLRLHADLGSWQEEDFAAANMSSLAIPPLLWVIGVAKEQKTGGHLAEVVADFHDDFDSDALIGKVSRRDEDEIDAALEAAQDAYEEIPEDISDEDELMTATWTIARTAALEWACGLVEDWDLMWSSDDEDE